MYRALLAGVVALTLMALPNGARAWSPEAHRVIAHLAYEQLTPTARAAVDDLIQKAPLQQTPTCQVASIDDASNWPDCVRAVRGFDSLAADDYENVPLCGVVPKIVYCPRGACLVDETRHAEAVLMDRAKPPLERLRALEEVVQFVADLEQPLDTANNGDHRGGDDRVTIDGRPSTLRRFWQTDVVEQALGRSEVAAEASLRSSVKDNANGPWRDGEPFDWLMDSHRLAVSTVYGKLSAPAACGRPAPPQALTKVYLRDADRVVRQQLAKAAVRLAGVLNDSLNSDR